MNTILNTIENIVRGEDLKATHICEVYPNLGSLREYLPNTYLIEGVSVEMYDPEEKEWFSIGQSSGAAVLSKEACPKHLLDEYYANTGGINIIVIERSYFNNNIDLVIFHEIGHILAYYFGGERFLFPDEVEKICECEAAADILAVYLYSAIMKAELEKAFEVYESLIDDLKSFLKSLKFSKERLKANIDAIDYRKDITMNYKNNDLNMIVEKFSEVI